MVPPYAVIKTAYGATSDNSGGHVGFQWVKPKNCAHSSCFVVVTCGLLPVDYIFNTLRPRQNGRHFPDDIFKSIFLNENVWISIKISLKFISVQLTIS